MNKKNALLIILVLVGFLLFRYLSNTGQHVIPSPITPKFVDLEIYIRSDQNGIWYRSINDLPEFQTSLQLDVWNYGSKDAKNVTLTVYKNNNLDYLIIVNINMNEHYTKDYNVIAQYNSSILIKIMTTCENEME